MSWAYGDIRVKNNAITLQGSAPEPELKPVPLVNDQRHTSDEGKFQTVVLVTRGSKLNLTYNLFDINVQIRLNVINQFLVG